MRRASRAVRRIPLSNLNAVAAGVFCHGPSRNPAGLIIPTVGLSHAIAMDKPVSTISRTGRTNAKGGATKRVQGSGRMRLAQKLNLKAGMKLRVVGKQADVDLDDVVVTSSTKGDAILVFVKTLAEVDRMCGPVVGAAKADRLAWIAYPKAKQLGTDLNRDILWRHLLTQHIQGVRQVPIDEVWSAMRFRPGK